MAERSKALDSKSSKGQLFGGSNPPLSVFFFSLGHSISNGVNSQRVFKDITLQS